jgi:NAD(P)-dependent dehydrogenase (short-subunit alcohol dehydrogenase family)
MASKKLSNAVDIRNQKGLAIITGGAAGIGLGLAIKAASYGMQPVLLDTNAAALSEAKNTIKNQIANTEAVMTMVCDVSDRSAMFNVAAAVEKAYPGRPISLVCANAGYGGPPILDSGEEALQRQVAVNQMGVIWTLQAFKSVYLAQSSPCALVATASAAGLITAAGSYGMTKHAVVAAMESVHSELQAKKLQQRVSCHVLCPGIVSTGIGNKAVESGEMRSIPGRAFNSLLVERGMSAAHIAEQVFLSVETGRFYCLEDHPDKAMNLDLRSLVNQRHQAIESGDPPAEKLSLTSGFLPTLLERIQELTDQQKGNGSAKCRL